MRSMTNMNARGAVVFGLAWRLLLSLAEPASGARAGLSLDPAVGPPTTLVKAKGSGFADRELVALYFDGDRIGSEVASRTGRFNDRLTVLAHARPGNHVVEAVGQSYV
jgi:hypothetical protein